jgi:hypothetical protein
MLPPAGSRRTERASGPARAAHALGSPFAPKPRLRGAPKEREPWRGPGLDVWRPDIGGIGGTPSREAGKGEDREAGKGEDREAGKGEDAGKIPDRYGVGHGAGR